MNANNVQQLFDEYEKKERKKNGRAKNIHNIIVFLLFWTLGSIELHKIISLKAITFIKCNLHFIIFRCSTLSSSSNWLYHISTNSHLCHPWKICMYLPSKAVSLFFFFYCISVMFYVVFGCRFFMYIFVVVLLFDWTLSLCWTFQ